MDNNIAVSIKNVSKKYRLYNSPHERFLEAMHPFKKKYHKEFWAVKDISFDVPQGKTVGIIGRNGCGKSTLLQLICSVLKPTSGEIVVNGRISALLELGAGFNPEFTGRENVLMQGQIMGFSTQEMQKRLPQIEAFADIGEFIDQPVKIYSSGMFVRLAFAAAINVDPDILVVDEALAVGDAKFQHKCYNKFLEFQQERKTIILVTHDTDAVIRHCDHAVLLDNGVIVNQGDPTEVTNQYFEILFAGRPQDKMSIEKKVDKAGCSLGKNGLEDFLKSDCSQDNCPFRKNYNKNEHKVDTGKAVIVDYCVVSGEEFDPVAITAGNRVDIYCKIKFMEDIANPVFSVGVRTVDGVIIYSTNSFFDKIRVSAVKKGETKIFSYSLDLNLQSGDYFIGADCSQATGDGVMLLHRRSALIHLKVEQKNIFGGIVSLGAVFSEK